MSYTNGYDAGYKKGYHDGYTLQTRSSVGGWGISEILRACVSPETYVDTFGKGYSKGYDDGLFLYNQESSLKIKKWKRRKVSPLASEGAYPIIFLRMYGRQFVYEI